MSLSVHVCGSAGTHPGPGRACSGYLVTAPASGGDDAQAPARGDATPGGAGPTRLLLDCGNGSLANVQRACELTDLDAVLLSHLHPDHCVDLFGLYYALRFHPAGPQSMPVYAPAGAEALLRLMLSAEAAMHLPKVCRFHTVAAGDTFAVGGLRVELRAANHPVETVAARIEGGGQTLAYSGDTHVTQEVVAAARDADLFICDATWLDREGPYPAGIHCTGAEAGRMAADAGAGRLLVTHVVPTTNSAEVAAEAAGFFGGEIAIAEDGLEIVL
jgi:ribonuclease BN (tRNA processing enzyme)